MRPLIPARRGVRPPTLPSSPSPPPPAAPPPSSPLLSVSAAQFIRFPLFLLFHANPSVDTSFTSRPHPPRSLSHVAPVGRQLRTSAPGLTGTRRARQTAEGTSSSRRRTFNSDCDRAASVESSRRKNVGSGIKLAACRLSLPALCCTWRTQLHGGDCQNANSMFG